MSQYTLQTTRGWYRSRPSPSPTGALGSPPSGAVAGSAEADETISKEGGLLKAQKPHKVSSCGFKLKALLQVESTVESTVTGIEVYVGSVGLGARWDVVTEYHAVPGTSRNVQVHYNS